MRISDKLRGTVRAEIRAAYPEAVLNACMQRGIYVKNVTRSDACTLCMELCERDWERVQSLAERMQAEAALRERCGGSRGRTWLRRRAALLLSLLCVTILFLWSECHVWEIEVHGCEEMTKGEILRALEDCGVSTGSCWLKLSSDAVRARMLLRLPELAWMTVNVGGSRARVYVVERVEKPEIYAEDAAADIRASQSGILRELTVLNGHPLVREGSAVVKGELLVTGSMDSLSHPTRRVRAEARILADTWYERTAVAPVGEEKKGKEGSAFGCLALRFGKTRVNLLAKSRKELDGYDKIVHEYTVGVKGLFAFPVSVIREKYQRGRMNSASVLSPGERLKKTLAEEIEGEILQSRVSSVSREECLYTTLRAHCLENIAQTAEDDPP